MKYYLVAGEASGDLHGSNLIKALKLLDSKATFRCWGGDMMQAAGAEIVSHYRERSFMGFLDVARNLSKVVQFIKQCKADIKANKPDAVILIDYPGFNLRIAEYVHKLDIRVFYYISPQVWAWKASRVQIIKKYVDRMLVILPFEETFYQKWNYPVDFVGHPLLDALSDLETDPDFMGINHLTDMPIVALLPGSRPQEIEKKLPVMSSVAPLFPEYQFVIGGLSSVNYNLYDPYLRYPNINIVYDQTYQLLSHAFAALVTSGTATLETALIGVPQVVCYRGDPISYSIGKRLVDVKFISLVNLIMDKLVVKELIQKDLTKENLTQSLSEILEDGRREQIFRDYDTLKIILGGPGASVRTAELIINYLRA